MFSSKRTPKNFIKKYDNYDNKLYHIIKIVIVFVSVVIIPLRHCTKVKRNPREYSLLSPFIFDNMVNKYGF